MKILLNILIIVIIASACKPRNAYYDIVERELASGKRVDSLFMGISLGMTAKEFYGHCWELNETGLVRQGPSNLSVEYDMKELPYPALMHFYPTFHEGIIYEMPVLFSYKSWAPWNKHLSSDSLQLEVLKLFKGWYGEEFIEVTDPQKGTAYVRVDGNRRISIFKKNESRVQALFTDLLLERELAKK